MCVPIENREECFNEETLRVLEMATGIFITGGNQLRLSTILGGTPVARRIRSAECAWGPCRRHLGGCGNRVGTHDRRRAERFLAAGKRGRTGARTGPHQPGDH